MSGYAMPKVGDVVAGKYRLEKVAGEGGMGLVYAAEHLVLKQRVAVKVLLPSAAASEAVVERFAREAQAAAKIQSEHVARVMDAGSTDGGAPFLVMEFLEGCDLEELLELQRKLPVEEAVDYVIMALDGLAHAHAAGIVHRDLKPANLFLACRPDGGNVLKLLDFGISKSIKASPEDKKLTGHHVLGSPVYMSPEQLRNSTDIDGRADLWSLGIVAYELLSGRVPFDGEGVGEIFAAVLEKEVESLSAVNPVVTPALAKVIEKCLSREPDQRWRDAGEMARALLPYASPACAPLVDRAEQVLARAKLLAVPDTPPEARVVVDAIVKAAERARTGVMTAPPPPHSERKKRLELATETSTDITHPDGLTTRAFAAAKRMPRSRLVGLVAAAVVLVSISAFAAVHAARTNAAAAAAASAAGNAPAIAGSGQAGEDEDENAPMVMDLPYNGGHASGNGPPRSRAVKSGRPQRPKFLKSRE